MKKGEKWDPEKLEQMRASCKQSWTGGSRRPSVNWSYLYAWLKRKHDLDPSDADILALGEVRELIKSEDER